MEYLQALRVMIGICDIELCKTNANNVKRTVSLKY